MTVWSPVSLSFGNFNGANVAVDLVSNIGSNLHYVASGYLIAMFSHINHLDLMRFLLYRYVLKSLSSLLIFHRNNVPVIFIPKNDKVSKEKKDDYLERIGE